MNAPRSSDDRYCASPQTANVLAPERPRSARLSSTVRSGFESIMSLIGAHHVLTASKMTLVRVY